MTVDGPEKPGEYSCLWEEYKLLQDKIDKIGGFRFQVKGWLIPLVSAWLVAVYTARITPLAYLIAAVFPLLFWLLEKNHHEHQSAFVRRIFAIEQELLSKANSPYFGPRPKVSKANRNKLLEIPPISPGQAISLTNRAMRKTRWGKLIMAAHGVFYWSVGVAVVLVSLLSIPPISTFLKKWASQEQLSQCVCVANLPTVPASVASCPPPSAPQQHELRTPLSLSDSHRLVMPPTTVSPTSSSPSVSTETVRPTPSKTTEPPASVATAAKGSLTKQLSAPPPAKKGSAQPAPNRPEFPTPDGGR